MAKASAQASQAVKRTVTVIYHPIDKLDPHTTKWNGITFKANVPVELDPDNPAHYIDQLLPKVITTAEGDLRTKHLPGQIFMGELAKGNPSFEVDGVRAKRKTNTRVVPPPGAEWTEANEGQISSSEEIDASVTV